MTHFVLCVGFLICVFTHYPYNPEISVSQNIPNARNFGKIPEMLENPSDAKFQFQIADLENVSQGSIPKGRGDSGIKSRPLLYKFDPFSVKLFEIILQTK